MSNASRTTARITRRQRHFTASVTIIRAAAADTTTGTQTPQAPFVAIKPTLFDVPISNNGARIRWIIYKKNLENEIDIVAPSAIGGLKSDTYLSLNPQGKMPLMALPGGMSLPESQVIESYMLDKYKGVGPDLIPSESPEARAVAALAARLLDVYITPIQGCMYKQMEAEDRFAKLKEIAFQLDAIEQHIFGTPFVAGSEISFGDAALFPTFVFFVNILPKYFGWKSVFTRRPKLQRWWKAVCDDKEAAKCIKEMEEGLKVWDNSNRWEALGITQQLEKYKAIDWTCGC